MNKLLTSMMAASLVLLPSLAYADTASQVNAPAQSAATTPAAYPACSATRLDSCNQDIKAPAAAHKSRHASGATRVYRLNAPAHGIAMKPLSHSHHGKAPKAAPVNELS